ncbi:MAG: ABC transporter permease [Actinomycetota bacterium]|nr:MAG: ABC transporter permease [Actinomycetota bacterium]
MTATTTAIAQVPVRRRPIWGWSVQDGLEVTKRNLLRSTRIPELFVFAIVQSIMFVLLFAYVFGGAIPVPGGGDYVSFLLPGIMAQTVAFAAAASTVGFAEDMSKGLIDRFRSLPMSVSAVLVGRTAGDAVRNLLQFVVLAVTGLIIGWRIENGFGNAVAAFALLLLFAYAFAWIGTWVGMLVPNTETANTAGFIWLFPVTFISSAFVPIEGMPSWLQPVAEWNPVSAASLAARELFGNPTGLPGDSWPMTHATLWTVLSSLILLLIFVPLSVRRYRGATAR